MIPSAVHLMREFRVTVLEDLAVPPRAEVRPRGLSRRERWLRRLPLLPALIYVIVVTQIPFLVTL